MTAFPSAPYDGETYTIGPRTWTYSQAQDAWVLSRTGPTGPTGVTGPQGPAGVLLTSLDVDTFIGDGTTSVFILSITPISAYNMIVNVDGLVQTANINYTVSGNHITFSIPPINNATIDVVHFLTGSAITGPTGPNSFPTINGPPLTSIGRNSDVAGDIAFSSSYLYYCTASYDGITNIWKRINWSNDIW